MHIPGRLAYCIYKLFHWIRQGYRQCIRLRLWAIRPHHSSNHTASDRWFDLMQGGAEGAAVCRGNASCQLRQPDRELAATRALSRETRTWKHFPGGESWMLLSLSFGLLLSGTQAFGAFWRRMTMGSDLSKGGEGRRGQVDGVSSQRWRCFSLSVLVWRLQPVNWSGTQKTYASWNLVLRYQKLF